MKKLTWLLLTTVLTGCAIGNEYQYRDTSIVLPIKSADQRMVILSVQDLRSYILNGEKDPSFVGLQRGGFGNPFDVTTSSGNPMEEDMAYALREGLLRVGYRVVNVAGKPDIGQLRNTAVKEGATRIVLLKVNEWKSDAYIKLNLHCDLQLEVYDAKGELLAENEMKLVQEVGGSITQLKNSQTMVEEFAKRMGYLFNKPAIHNALG